MINSHIRDTVIHDLQVIAAARILVTATAIHRYHQKRSTYPATLEGAVRSALDVVPRLLAMHGAVAEVTA